MYVVCINLYLPGEKGSWPEPPPESKHTLFLTFYKILYINKRTPPKFLATEPFYIFSYYNKFKIILRDCK